LAAIVVAFQTIPPGAGATGAVVVGADTAVDDGAVVDGGTAVVGAEVAGTVALGGAVVEVGLEQPAIKETRIITMKNADRYLNAALLGRFIFSTP